MSKVLWCDFLKSVDRMEEEIDCLCGFLHGKKKSCSWRRGKHKDACFQDCGHMEKDVIELEKAFQQYSHDIQR